jgi:pyruvate/2-oxoglutarate dehydrogenase complex dihydrolipoamide acyltransferase (E2) component
VTYRGPDNWFRIDEPETITFHRGVAVETTAEVAAVLAKQEGHEFLEGDEPEPIGPKATDAAAKLAEEKGIDLASIAKPSGANGDITVEDVKAAVEAAEANDQPDQGSTE